MKHGLIENLPAADYHAAPGLSSSEIKRLLVSPAHFKQYQPYETAAMEFGTAVHCAILEPEAFAATYLVEEKIDRRSKDGKLAYEALLASGKKLLKPEQWDAIMAMRTRFMEHAICKNLITGSRSEVSAFATHAYTGVPVRARADIYKHAQDDAPMIADIKTCDDARPHAAASAICKYGYDISAAWYLDTFHQATGTPHHNFIWIFMEKSAPYGIRTYLANYETIQNGRRLYEKALAEYKVSLDFGEWPCYKEQLEDISLPNWYVEKEY